MRTTSLHSTANQQSLALMYAGDHTSSIPRAIESVDHAIETITRCDIGSSPSNSLAEENVLEHVDLSSALRRHCTSSVVQGVIYT